jgi:hypothetical protein
MGLEYYQMLHRTYHACVSLHGNDVRNYYMQALYNSDEISNPLSVLNNVTDNETVSSMFDMVDELIDISKEESKKLKYLGSKVDEYPFHVRHYGNSIAVTRLHTYEHYLYLQDSHILKDIFSGKAKLVYQRDDQ